LRDLCFDLLRNFRECRCAVGRREFYAVVLRRIVRRGEVDGAVGMPTHDLPGDGRCRRCIGDGEGLNAVGFQNSRGEVDKAFAEEAGIATDDQASSAWLHADDIACDTSYRSTNVVERKLLGHDGPPTRSPKLDLCRHCLSTLVAAEVEKVCPKRRRLE